MLEQPKINILAVDDVRENLISVGSILEELEIEIDYANNGNEALGKLLENEYALVLLDVQMPGIDGFEVAKLMRGSERTKHIPIIFLTAISKEQRHIHIGYDSGAVDYLFKPIEPEILKSKVKVFVDLYRQKIALEEITFKLENTITELIDSRESLKKAKGIAEQASKTKSEFLANMSHELRTPLNGIIGMAELTLMGELNKIQKDRVQTIKQSGESLLDILNEILDISKIEADKMVLEEIEFNIRDIVEKVVRMLAVKTTEKGIELLCDIKNNVPSKLYGDPVRIRQVMFNLLGNAIKFTDQGEVGIYISVENKLKNDLFELNITVEDTGIGIEESKIDSLFESFNQADTSTTRKYGGTGLGLPISKKLVEMMKGNIKVISKPGEGSSFICTISLKGEPCIISNVTVDPALTKTLVLDDNQEALRIVANKLEGYKIQHHLFNKSDELLKHLKSQTTETAHFILIDSDLKNESGIEVAKQISELKLPDKPQIVLMASSSKDVELCKLKEAGISRYMIKPLLRKDFSELYEKHKTTISQKEALQNQIETKEDRCNGNAVKILLAEDNLINQKLAFGFMQLNGWHVTVANNGIEAYDYATKNSYDLIFMDVQMPEMDGLETTKKIREYEVNTPNHVPIVAMTAHAMKGDKEKCLEAGMDDYLTKPIHNNQLIEKVDKYVNNN